MCRKNTDYMAGLHAATEMMTRTVNHWQERRLRRYAARQDERHYSRYADDWDREADE